MKRAERQQAVDALSADGLSPRQIAATLAVPEATIYADLRRADSYTPRSAVVAERRARVLALYNDGKSQPQIAEALGMARATVALDLKSSDGYCSRTVAQQGWVTASTAARTHGVDLWALCAAIDAGRVRGRTESSGRRTVRFVQPHEIAIDLASLPVCLERGCTRIALRPSGYCSGAHARAAETRGTKRSGETCRRIAAGKRGKPRPDVRERVAAMHADPKTKYAWAVRLVEGREASPASSISANAKRRWKGRHGGLAAARAAGRQGGKKPIEASSDPGVQEKVKRARELHRKGHSLRGIATLTGLTKRQVEGIIARAKVSP